MSTSTRFSSTSGTTIAGLLANPADGAHRIDARAGVTLYEPDTKAQNLYYIDSGQIRLYQVGPDASSRLTDILGAGEWFGIAALAGAQSYGSRAIVMTASVVWALPSLRLMELLGTEPKAAIELVAQLAARLEAAQYDAARLVFDDCNQRLIQTLLRFSRTAAATPQADGEVVLRITHEQLAQAVGAARETVSLALTQLRLRNLLRTGRNRLLFKPDNLQQFCRTTCDASVPVQANSELVNIS